MLDPPVTLGPGRLSSTGLRGSFHVGHDRCNMLGLLVYVALSSPSCTNRWDRHHPSFRQLRNCLRTPGSLCFRHYRQSAVALATGNFMLASPLRSFKMQSSGRNRGLLSCDCYYSMKVREMEVVVVVRVISEVVATVTSGKRSLPAVVRPECKSPRSTGWQPRYVLLHNENSLDELDHTRK